MIDGVNSIFLSLGGFFVGLSCLKMYVNKSSEGVSLGHALFMMVWSLWNLYFFASIEAWWSLLGAVGIAVANSTWCALVCKYREGVGR